jgi:hypothetical protein
MWKVVMVCPLPPREWQTLCRPGAPKFRKLFATASAYYGWDIICE